MWAEVSRLPRSCYRVFFSGIYLVTSRETGLRSASACQSQPKCLFCWKRNWVRVGQWKPLWEKEQNLARLLSLPAPAPGNLWNAGWVYSRSYPSLGPTGSPSAARAPRAWASELDRLDSNAGISFSEHFHVFLIHPPPRFPLMLHSPPNASYHVFFFSQTSLCTCPICLLIGKTFLCLTWKSWGVLAPLAVPLHSETCFPGFCLLCCLAAGAPLRALFRDCDLPEWLGVWDSASGESFNRPSAAQACKTWGILAQGGDTFPPPLLALPVTSDTTGFLSFPAPRLWSPGSAHTEGEIPAPVPSLRVLTEPGHRPRPLTLGSCLF